VQVSAREVEALYARARRKHPEFAVPVDELARALRQAAAGADAFAEDLYLAVAIGRGDAAALAVLDAMLARLEPALRRIDADEAFVAEVKQTLRIKLALTEGSRVAGTRTYRGTGPLGKWLRATALNTALRLHAQRRPSGSSEPLQLAAKLDSAELKLLRARHQRDFDAAFTTALRRLTARERSVLKLRFVEGVGLEEIAAFLHVDRSTAVRALRTMRDRLTGELRAELGGALKLSPSEIDSLVRAMGSDFRISVGRLLKAL
jgi:RNA polymerase sigma-70 factor, ECF subfamily